MSETLDTGAPRSRRALLTAAAGAAAAVAATAVAPVTTLATDPNDVVMNQDNATTAITSITQGTADTDAFHATGKGKGVGLVGKTETNWNAGIVAVAGDITNSLFADEARDYGIDSALYAYGNNNTGYSNGVWAEGATGVYAFADWGVYADGYTLGVFGGAYNNGTGVHGHTGNATPPDPVANVALRGTVTNAATQFGLQAYGRVQFPNRSGRVSFGAGVATKTLTITGVVSTSIVLAVVNTNRAGVYVRAAVPSTNHVTIYLSKAPTAATIVAWLVLS